MRTITVKGVGKVTVKPDYIEITMKLEAKGKLYAKVMEQATEQLSRLNKALEAIGFEKDSLKTSNLTYRQIKSVARILEEIFSGYSANLYASIS